MDLELDPRDIEGGWFLLRWNAVSTQRGEGWERKTEHASFEYHDLDTGVRSRDALRTQSPNFRDSCVYVVFIRGHVSVSVAARNNTWVLLFNDFPAYFSIQGLSLNIDFFQLS